MQRMSAADLPPLALPRHGVVLLFNSGVTIYIKTTDQSYKSMTHKGCIWYVRSLVDGPSPPLSTSFSKNIVITLAQKKYL